MHRGSIFWGVILLLLGGLLLTQNLGILPPNINIWGIFWPLVLIALGIVGVTRALSPRRSLITEPVRIPLGGARLAEVRIQHGAGDLRVDGSAGPDDLVDGTFAGGVQHYISQNGDEVVVTLRPPQGEIHGVFPPFESNGFNWRVGLNREIPLALHFELGASSNHLDLRDLQARDVRLETGVSSSVITFPAGAGAVRATLKSGAASVEAYIPENVAARIRTKAGMESIDVDTRRFPRVGSEYISPDYDTAENRLDLDIETGLGSVSVK